MSVTITKTRSGKFKVSLYKHETKKSDHIGIYESIEEAEKESNKSEISYYKSHSELLPKGISVGGNVFRLAIKSYTISGKYNDLKWIASAKSLNEIKELKMKCLNSIVG